MTYLLATKASIKANYIATLQNIYPFYTEGSKPLELANKAVDNALNGKLKLAGAAWEQALKLHGINQKEITMKELAALPSGAEA